MYRFQRQHQLIAVLLVALACSLGCKKSESPAAPAKSDTSSAGKPVIFAAETEYKFGTVKQGAEVEHVFKIKNNGAQNLVIEKTTGS